MTIGGADGGVAATPGGSEVRGHAEVHKLDVGLLSEEDVVALDVSMHHVVLVQVDHCLQCKSPYVLCVNLENPRSERLQDQRLEKLVKHSGRQSVTVQDYT
ncbi:hypothetical protein E2C01_037314 [Portunus trituberculatus]|uniref:Uncharacterized protein n=1 Tax=Portunus trituberculatus TaxID=210409 RepID=A0A5B7FF02_PORTR|nr:hypothetical protein [Portunus trituberculatus]